jgi:hypothetical protein
MYFSSCLKRVAVYTVTSFFLLLALLSTVPAFALGPDDALPPHRDGTVLLKFREGISPAVKNTILSLVGGSALKEIGSGVIVVNVGNGRVFSVLQSLKAFSEVFYIEPDYQSLGFDDATGPIAELPDLQAHMQPSSATGTGTGSLTANAQSSTIDVTPNDGKYRRR